MNLTPWRSSPAGSGQKAEQKAASLGGMVHSGAQTILSWLGAEGLLPGSKTNYAKVVGDGLGSSVLAAPLNWIMRTFPEAPIVVERRDGEQWVTDQDHDLTQLLDTPNPSYSGETLLMATVLDLCFGNAYWIKLRNRGGQVVQLWWAPRQLMIPRYPFDGTKFIDHYDYRPGGQTLEIAPEDVVHFRFGLDPKNPRLGLSQLGSLMREIAIDDFAASFTSSILQNLGIIGVVISPKEGTGAGNKGAVEEVKAYLKANFSGDRRGSPLAVGAPTDVQLLQYNMQGFDVGPIRDVSEERVCAAIGIPAAVVGFGTGLQQTKVGATMKEMRQLAWINGIIPLQRMMSREIKRSLLIADFNAPDRRMRFDTSEVRALWETPTEKHDRVRKDFQAAMIMRSTAKRELGYPVADGDDVYVQPVNVLQLSPGETAPPKDPNAPPLDNTDPEDGQ